MKKHHIVTVCVNYPRPIPFEDKATGATSTRRGYFRKLGISTAWDEPVQNAVTRLVRDGTVDWNETETQEVRWDDLDHEIKAHAEGFGSRHCWYSGPAFLFS